MDVVSILESLLDILGEKAAVIDRSGTILAVGSRWGEFNSNTTNTKAGSGVGTNYLEVCRRVAGKDREDALMAVDVIESVLSGAVSVRSFEYICDLPSGPTPFVMTVKAFAGADGGAVVIHSRSGSVTPSERLDLGSSIDRLRRMVDVVPALLSYVDHDRRYRFVNKRYSDWFGHEPEDVVGKRLEEVIGNEAYEAMLPDFERVFRGEEVDFERLLNYRDGGDRFVSGSLIPDLDEAGTVQGYFALLIDNTEQHRVEEELRLSEERFSKLFNFIPIAITISSIKEGKYIAVNEAYLQATGFDREAVLGRPTTESGISMPEERVREFFATMEREGSVTNFETDLDYGDGRHHTVLLNAVNLELGGENYLAVAANNITARKVAEQSLQELTTRLLNSQDSERRRIARELHDTTAQKISAILLSLSYIRKLIDKPRREFSQALADAIRYAEESLGEIRTLSYLLHPPLLDNAGLRSAIRWFADGFSLRSGIDVEVAFAGNEKRLPQEMEGAIFRIVQEALTNVHRHSGSSNAFILLEVRENELLLEVRDEGNAILWRSHDTEGKELSDLERLGVGIRGMRERLRQFGGDLSLDTDHSGTKVTARIPLND